LDHKLETIMTQTPSLAFCQFRNTDVDLRQGFHHCIENNQCFSDEPCPLDGKFHEPNATAHLKAHLAHIVKNSVNQLKR